MTGWDTMVNWKAMIPFETPMVNEKKLVSEIVNLYIACGGNDGDRYV